MLTDSFRTLFLFFFPKKKAFFISYWESCSLESRYCSHKWAAKTSHNCRSMHITTEPHLQLSSCVITTVRREKIWSDPREAERYKCMWISQYIRVYGNRSGQAVSLFDATITKKCVSAAATGQRLSTHGHVIFNLGFWMQLKSTDSSRAALVQEQQPFTSSLTLIKELVCSKWHSFCINEPLEKWGYKLWN